MTVAGHDITAHPLRAEDMRLDIALARAGLVAASRPKRWRPWNWEAQRALYYRLGYVPSPGQRAFHLSNARVKVLCAGSRFGKSMVAARDLLPIICTPGTNTWILGPTYDLAEKEWRILTEDLERCGLMQFARVKQLGKPGHLEFDWGARVWTRSADNPSSLLGEEVDCVLLSEASQLPERIFTRYVRARVGSRLGRILIPTTPFGYNWVRKQWESGQNAGGVASLSWAESVASWQFSVLENPTFEPDEYLAAHAAMPPEEFAEQWDGRFTTMSGRIIPGFDARKHTIPPARLPQELHGMPVFRTIDFGFSNPSVCLWCVFDVQGIEYSLADGTRAKAPPKTWWVVGEVYKRQLITEDFAEEIKSHPWTKAHRIVCTIGDMADAQARATLARRGVPCAAEVSRIFEDERVPIDKAWEAGIRSMRAIAHQGRLLVSAECKNTIRELNEATFADDARDRQEAGQDDHALDACRYLLHTLTPA